jgi:hypothetical protein
MSGAAIGWFKRDERTPTAFVHNILLTNCIYANNLFFHRNPKVQTAAGGGIGWQSWRTTSPWGNTVHYSKERDVVFDYNTHAGSYADVRKIGFFNNLYDTGEAMAATSIWKHNRSTSPVFVREGVDFDLASSDTSALNLGTNLSHLYNFDILNRPRGTGGAWDRGAFESGELVTAAPGSFALASPASGATGQSLVPTLSWNVSAGAVSYQVEIDSDSTFGAPLVHSATTGANSLAVPSAILSGGVQYFWRVRAVNSVGTTLAANAPFSFTTQSGAGSAPGAFVLATPVSGATGVSPTTPLTWSDAAGETSYVLEIDTESGFGAPLSYSVTLTAGTTSHAVPSGTLSAGASYFWRVRAVNSSGVTVAGNAPFGFSLQSAATGLPGAFVLSTPASNSGNVPVAASFTWTDSTGEQSYIVEVDTDSGFTSPLAYQATLPANTLSTTLPSGILSGSSQYYWRVKARNSAGDTLAGYSPRGFTTAVGGSGGGSSTNSLLVWLKFDDDFSDSRLEDSSGNGNHGHRFGRIGSAFPTNFPRRVLASAAASTVIRTNVSASDYAGDFLWYNTGYGLYGIEGDYVGITNGVSRMTNMARASIMCWARYESAPYGNNHSVDGNATLLSAGTSAGVPGSWDFGRYNRNVWLNNTRFYIITNQATFAKHVVEFPDRGYDNNGDTTNWNHYAITWDSGVVRGYLNGRPIATNDLSAIVTTLKIGRNPNNATPWIGIGCNTHSGTPWLNDEAPNIEYPNHGFMNGVIDDVRIYERALSAGEIQAVVGGAAGPRPPAAPGGIRVVGSP